MMRKLIKYQGVCIAWWGPGESENLRFLGLYNASPGRWVYIQVGKCVSNPYFLFPILSCLKVISISFAYLSPYHWFHICNNLLHGWWLLVNWQSRFVSEDWVVWKYNLCKVLISSCGLFKWCFAVWKVSFMRFGSYCKATWMFGRPKTWLHCVNATIFLQGWQNAARIVTIWH